MNKASELLQKARELASSATSWADLSNALFDAVDGIVARAFESRAEREAFAQTPEYRQIPPWSMRHGIASVWWLERLRKGVASWCVSPAHCKLLWNGKPLPRGSAWTSWWSPNWPCNAKT